MTETPAPGTHTAGNADTDPPKQITGYCEPWTLRAGESIRLMASSHQPGPAEIDITQIVCGDPTRYGPGFDERPAAAAGSWSVALDEQSLTPGSYGVAAVDGVPSTRRLGLRVWLMPTLPDRPARIATLCAHTAGSSPDSAAIEALRVDLSGGRAVASTSAFGDEVQAVADELPLTRDRWYLFDVELDLDAGTLSAAVTTTVSDSPGRDAVEGTRLSDLTVSELEAESAGAAHEDVSRLGIGAFASVATPVDAAAFVPAELWLAAGPGGGRFDGRLARPTLRADDATVSWDLAADMAGRTVPADDPACGPIVLHQLPTRAITGPAWDGTAHRWTDNPSHFDAVHFHHDDLYDAGWETTVEATLPGDLPSGIYAFRVRGDAGEDRVPFFVRPARGARTADVAMLMPTATYMAYANHRMLFEGADFIPTKTRLRPEHGYISDHPELGRSHYEKHPDRSGVMFSSRRRPVLNLRPGADGWNFTPDTDINAFLEHLEIGHDIVTDEDLHVAGVDAIAPYRVLVTGSHPEYWSTDMLDALADWQRNGGRLMYLGGNGFYWATTYDPGRRHVVEIRRGFAGSRAWESHPGETQFASTGEQCGIWRHLGRPPNAIVGTGFSCQGWDAHTPGYKRLPGSFDPRAAFIFEGVGDDEIIGDFGLVMNGCAGDELDRVDHNLGTPSHTLVLATSAGQHSAYYLICHEDIYVMHANIDATRNDDARADMVYFETANGGAVFSVSSINWFSGLSHNDYDNNVSRITSNVLNNFLA